MSEFNKWSMREIGDPNDKPKQPEQPNRITLRPGVYTVRLTEFHVPDIFRMSEESENVVLIFEPGSITQPPS